MKYLERAKQIVKSFFFLGYLLITIDYIKFTSVVGNQFSNVWNNLVACVVIPDSYLIQNCCTCSRKTVLVRQLR